MKYGEWTRCWLCGIIGLTVKESTQKKYSIIAEHHLLPYFGSRELSEIEAVDLQMFCGEKLKSGLASNTINNIITVLKQSLKSAFRCGLVKTDFSTSFVRAKTRERKVCAFEWREQKKIENYIWESNDPKLFGIILALYTGMRIGELLALTWDDVDLSKGLIHVNKSCRDEWRNGHYIKRIDTTKTGSSDRVIPIAKGLIKRLRELKKSSPTEFIIRGKSEYGAQIRCYQRTFGQLLQKLNIRHRGFHSLRHTFATRAVEAGMDVKSLADILGHSNPAITLKRYAQSMLDYKVLLINKIGRFIPDL